MNRAPTLQIVTALAAFVLFAVALPIRMDDPAARSSTDECLMLSSRAPSHEAAAPIASYLRCLELDPRDLVLMRDAGALYEESGDLARAEAIYRRALAIDPSFAELHTRLGWILVRRGDKAGALVEANRAATLTLNAPSALALQEAAR